METEWLFFDFSENEMAFFVFVLTKLKVWEKAIIYIYLRKNIKPTVNYECNSKIYFLNCGFIMLCFV